MAPVLPFELLRDWQRLLVMIVPAVPYPVALAWVATIYTPGQLIESFIASPRLVGERIGPHPPAVIFVLMAFGELFGIAGALMAGFRHVRAHYLRSSFYNAERT